MPVTVYGRATIYGVGGTVLFAGQASHTILEPTKVSVKDNTEVKKAKDGTGKTFALAAVDPTDALTVDVIPTAGTGTGNNTLDNAKAAVAKPGIFAKVTLDGFGIEWLDGDWNYMGGGSADLADDFVKMSLPCERFDGAALDVIDS